MTHPTCMQCGRLLPMSFIRNTQPQKQLVFKRNYSSKHKLPLDMRSEFNFGPKPEVKRWFPKHMQVGRYFSFCFFNLSSPRQGFMLKTGFQFFPVAAPLKYCFIRPCDSGIYDIELSARTP